jgi:hypothetical protein
MSSDARYAHVVLAWEYDQRNGTIAPGELAWYLKYAGLTDRYVAFDDITHEVVWYRATWS